MIIPPDGQGNEPREPKYHGDGVQGQNGKLVGEALEESRGQSEIWQHQHGPDGDEDEEADFGRSIREWNVVEFVGRCVSESVGKESAEQGECEFNVQ